MIGAIIAPGTLHTNLLNSIEFEKSEDMVLFSGYTASLPFDFIIKSLGKGDLYDDSIKKLPFLRTKHAKDICLRALRLNCLTEDYAKLWKESFCEEYRSSAYSIESPMLDTKCFSRLNGEWSKSHAVQSDYERYISLIELDVLCCMAFGITLNELKVMYRIQFPVLQSYSTDTWYDSNGRITFTNNRSLVGVGFDRKEFELNMKDAPAGKKFYRTIMDDTMPGGPVERTIEYVAPFDRCSREQDYEIAWKFFEKKYGKDAKE